MTLIGKCPDPNGSWWCVGCTRCSYHRLERYNRGHSQPCPDCSGRLSAWWCVITGATIRNGNGPKDNGNGG